jgi:hypothetical protein
MVRLRKEDTEDLNVEELDAVEYSDEQFDSYDGEVPPKDLELTGFVRKMWWTRSGAGDPMLKVLWVAAENDGDNDEYNGCPFWLNAALIGAAKFRWAPFLDNFGITLKQVKNNTDVQDKDDQNGAPINKIANWRPGEENDEAWCRIITDRERYQGEWQPKVKTWLPYDADEADEEPADDEETDDEYDEEDEDDSEPEPEPEPEPARGRGRGAARNAPDKAAPARSGRGTRAAAPAADKPAPARTARGARPAKAAAPAEKPARGRGRARSKDGYDDEPPF